MTKYITTDSNSKINLEHGKYYFVDFLVDKNEIPNTRSAKALIEKALRKEFDKADHEINDIGIVISNYNDTTIGIGVTPSGSIVAPDNPYAMDFGPIGLQEKIRIYFRVNSVTVTTLIALALLAIITGALAYGSYYLAPVFLGFGAAVENVATCLTDVFKVPELIIENATNAVTTAPMAVIAIIIAIGIFILGRKIL